MCRTVQVLYYSGAWSLTTLISTRGCGTLWLTGSSLAHALLRYVQFPRSRQSCPNRNPVADGYRVLCWDVVLMRAKHKRGVVRRSWDSRRWLVLPMAFLMTLNQSACMKLSCNFCSSLICSSAPPSSARALASSCPPLSGTMQAFV
jgi:hypothetical protein